MNWTYGRVGYVLATEEHPARDLVRYGALAEEAGLGFLFVSDHFHPWNFEQGHSSNVWPVLGALSQSTSRVGLVSAVTCPIQRIHPTTLAQAASTLHHLSEGRFVLGLGTGEALNEAVVGEGFPAFPERLERLTEAVSHLRALLTGREVDLSGEYFTTQRAQLFDAVEDLPILCAAGGARSAKLAGELADGVITLGCRPELTESLPSSHVCLAQLSVCWAPELQQAVQTAHRVFPEVAMEGDLFTRLSHPADYREAARGVTVDDVRASIVCGPDPAPYLQELRLCLEAGYDGVALHQIGPCQTEFLDFLKGEILPVFSRPSSLKTVPESRR